MAQTVLGPEPPVLQALLETFGQMTAVYNRSPQQQIKHNGLIDHLPQPPSGIFHPDFSIVEAGAKEIINDLKKVVSMTHNRMPAWAILRDALEFSSTPWKSEHVRLAIIGAIGAGKSYLVGTLLGDAAIVKEVSVCDVSRFSPLNGSRAAVGEA